MYQLNIYALPNITCAIFCFSIGFLVFIKNRESRINRIFFLFTLSGAIWQIGSFLALLSTEPGPALHWCKFSYIGVLFIPITTYDFITQILNKKRQRKFVFIVYLIGIFGFLPLVKSKYFFSGVNRYSWGYWFKAGPLYSLFLLFFAVLMSLAFINLYSSYKKETSSLEKMRERFLFIAFLISIIGSIDYLPAYQVSVYPFGYIPIFIYLSIMAYTIVRYRLMAINIVLTRAGIFSIVYALVLGIPFWLGYTTKSWFLSTTLAVFLATFGPFIYTFLRRRAEDALLRDQHRYQEALRRASKGMTLIKELKTLLHYIVGILTRFIHITHAAIYLYDPKRKAYVLKACRAAKISDDLNNIGLNSALINCLRIMKNPIPTEDLKNANGLKAVKKEDINSAITTARNLKAALIVPSFVEKDLLGFVVLGEKIAGHAYTDDDISVLSVLANQAALAIENAQFYEQAKLDEAERIQTEKFATIGRLATSAKHEINNPLQMICWNLDVIKDALTDTQDNFKGARERLSKLLENIELMMKNQKDGPAKINELKVLFGKVYSILDRKGESDAQFVNSIKAFCAECGNTQKELISSADSITDEKTKISVQDLAHFYGAISENVFKIIDVEDELQSNIASGLENAKRIEDQVEIMHELPTAMDKEFAPVEASKVIAAGLAFARQQTYWENLGETPVERHIPEDLPKIKGYFNRLVIVILNLTINAYQAMTDAGLTDSKDRLIKIDAKVSPDDPSFIEIHFANKGPLIPETNIEKIFERDFTTKKKGSGLGLHLSRIQVEMHNGALYAKNIAGFGPEFVLKLPRWEA